MKRRVRRERKISRFAFTKEMNEAREQEEEKEKSY